MVARKIEKKNMNPEGFEPPTFGSGIRRAAVAPWVRGATEPGPRPTQNPEKVSDYHEQKKESPPLGIEPRTCRLTADRSANGALEATFPDRELNPGLAGESRLS